MTAGESHGPELVALVEGIPANVPVSAERIRRELARRRLGFGRGARMKFEQDELSFAGGVRHGLSLGGPIALRIGNTEWPKWVDVMSAEPVDPEKLEGGRGAALTKPRPGHADLVGMQKYGFDEARPVLERASARETAARVACGAVAKAFLAELGIEVLSHTVAIGPERSTGALPTPADLDAIDDDPVRCFEAEASARMVREVEATKAAGDTVGGVVEVLAYGLPPGLGSHVHWDRKLDARLAFALMSIQAIKGVGVGDGFDTAARRGSAAHDEIFAGEHGLERATDRAGGIEGGMSTGTVLRVSAAMKPIATVPRALRTVDVATGEASGANHQRSDVCAVPAAGVVAEAMVALVVADAVAEKFGGDSVAETKRNLRSYLENVPEAHRSATASNPQHDTDNSTRETVLTRDEPDERSTTP